MMQNLDDGQSREDVARLFFAEPGELEEAVRIYREHGVEGCSAASDRSERRSSPYPR